MTKEEFARLPYLLTPGQVVACGYAPATLAKYVAHALLRTVRPRGCVQKRFQKLQVAQLLGWEEGVDRKAWRQEKPLVGLASVRQWTGYTTETISHIIAAGGLIAVQPGGVGERKFRRDEIGAWLGF